LSWFTFDRLLTCDFYRFEEFDNDRAIPKSCGANLVTKDGSGCLQTPSPLHEDRISR